MDFPLVLSYDDYQLLLAAMEILRSNHTAVIIALIFMKRVRGPGGIEKVVWT